MDYTQKAKATVDKLYELARDHKGHWREVSVKEKDVKLDSLEVSETPITIKRAKGIIHCNARKLFDYMWKQTLEDKKKYEDTLAEDKIIQPLNDDSHIRYQIYKFPWPLDNRDAVLLRTRKIMEDGTCIQAETSIEIDKNLEPQKGHGKEIRSKMHIAGYVYKPLEENKCEVTYISQIDPQGNVGKLANKGEKKVAQRIEVMRQIAKDHHL